MTHSLPRLPYALDGLAQLLGQIARNSAGHATPLNRVSPAARRASLVYSLLAPAESYPARTAGILPAPTPPRQPCCSGG